jgi:predicted ATP-dependent endonuclease of OLD family
LTEFADPLVADAVAQIRDQLAAGTSCIVLRGHTRVGKSAIISALLVLARRVILVEGPSDELVVQRAYRDAHNGRLPIQDGVDVMSMDSLSAKRFLDIAVQLKKPVVVITDNDGDEEATQAKFTDYAVHDFIRVCVGMGDERTLEPQLLTANDLKTLNRVLGATYDTDERLLKYMKRAKTACALAIFESAETITMPEYIRDAVA